LAISFIPEKVIKLPESSDSKPFNYHFISKKIFVSLKIKRYKNENS